MKTCPYCAEQIQDAAIVCRYCGRDVPSAGPPLVPQTDPSSSSGATAAPTNVSVRPVLGPKQTVLVCVGLIAWFGVFAISRDSMLTASLLMIAVGAIIGMIVVARVRPATPHVSAISRLASWRPGWTWGILLTVGTAALFGLFATIGERMEVKAKQAHDAKMAAARRISAERAKAAADQAARSFPERVPSIRERLVSIEVATKSKDWSNAEQRLQALQTELRPLFGSELADSPEVIALRRATPEESQRRRFPDVRSDGPTDRHSLLSCHLVRRRAEQLQCGNTNALSV